MRVRNTTELKGVAEVHDIDWAAMGSHVVLQLAIYALYKGMPVCNQWQSSSEVPRSGLAAQHRLHTWVCAVPD